MTLSSIFEVILLAGLIQLLIYIYLIIFYIWLQINACSLFLVAFMIFIMFIVYLLHWLKVVLNFNCVLRRLLFLICYYFNFFDCGVLFFVVIDWWMHCHICLANRISSAVVKDWFVKITGWFLLQSGIHSNTLTTNAIFFWFLLHVFIIVTNEFFNWIYLFFLFFINWFSFLLNCFQKFILIWLFLHKIVWKLL
jgi:hypothetical protein